MFKRNKQITPSKKPTANTISFADLIMVLGLVLFLLAACSVGKRNLSRNTIDRNEIIDKMQEVMGPLPSRKSLPPFHTRITDSVKGKGHTRYNIVLTVAENELLPALLYIPDRGKTNDKLPAVLVLHSTDVLGKMVLSGESPKPDRAYAVELAERGYVVIAPDYPGFGDMKDYDFENDRYASGTMKAIFNHIRCVDFLQSLKDADPSRIGVLGHSLGGHNAIFVAAFDKRIKVAVSSCGWTLFDHYDAGESATKLYGGKLGPWAQDKYMPLIKTRYDLDPAKIPFDFDDVISLIAPRAFFSNSPLGDANFNVDGVKKGMERVEKAYRDLNAESNLKVAYPDARHDFPKAVRIEAYLFMDSVLQHKSREHELHR